MKSSINRKTNQSNWYAPLYLSLYILTLCVSSMTAEDDIRDPEPVFILEVSICLY